MSSSARRKSVAFWIHFTLTAPREMNATNPVATNRPFASPLVQQAIGDLRRPQVHCMGRANE